MFCQIQKYFDIRNNLFIDEKAQAQGRGEEESTRSGALKGRAAFKETPERGTSWKVQRAGETKEENSQEIRMTLFKLFQLFLVA